MWEHKWTSLISVSPPSQLFLRLFKSFFEVIETRKTAQWENGAFKVAVYLGFCLKFLQNWIKLKMTLVTFLFYNNVLRNVTYIWGLKREKLKLECIVLIMVMLRHLCTSNWHANAYYMVWRLTPELVKYKQIMTTFSCSGIYSSASRSPCKFENIQTTTWVN